MLPSGRWNLVKLRCSFGLLSPADIEAFRAKFPNPHRSRSLLAKAFIDGMVAYFKTIYLRRWAIANRRPDSTFKHGSDSDLAFREAALFCFGNGISVERFLACAEDTIRSVRYPTPAHLKGPFLKRVAPEWIPPSERRKPDEEEGEVFFIENYPDVRQQVDTHVPLDRNWPGLYDSAPGRRARR